MTTIINTRADLDALKGTSDYLPALRAIAGTMDTTVDPDWSNKIVAANTNAASKTLFIDGMDHTFNVFAEADLHSLHTAIDATGEFFAATLK